MFIVKFYNYVETKSLIPLLYDRAIIAWNKLIFLDGKISATK